MRIAYFLSRHPLVSQVFIAREIQGLRACGVEVQPIAVRRASPADLLTASDVEADRETLALLPITGRALIAAHLQGLSHPWAYARTLLHAVSRSGPGRMKQLFYFGESMILLDHLRRREIKHLHVHFVGNAAEIAYIARYFSRLGGDGIAGYSLTVHGPTDFFNVEKWRLREKVDAAEGVVAISDYARSQVMTHLDWPPKTPVRVAHYGVEAVAPADRSPHKPPVILCVGRLVPAKAHSVLLEAAARLMHSGVEFLLILVGDGPLREYLHSEAERLGILARIQFLGARGSDEVAALYSRADIFCLPSFAEGLPVVLMEAMSFGLAVVATRITGVPELVDDGVSGLLVTPGRVDELAAALDGLLQDVPARQLLGKNAVRTVLGDFRSDNAGRHLAAVLRGFHRVTE